MNSQAELLLTSSAAAHECVISQAMQQGGVGLILTTLILTTPPMAAMFFQGTLGNFMAYSQIGGGAATPGPRGEAPGSYTPNTPDQKVERDSAMAPSSSYPRFRPWDEPVEQARQSARGNAGGDRN